MITARWDVAGRAAGGVFAAAAAVTLAAAPARALQQPRSQCVVCHGRLPEATGAGHGFAAWRSSRHAAAGVSCEACHGGNPEARDAQAAHQGVSRSSERASRVYFARIPDTCGRCHAAEAAYFRSSIHYARLESDGRGPNCVTCHGSMATSVLTPEHLLGTCSACHAPNGVAPVGKAREAAQVLALVRAENLLYDVVSSVAASGRSASGAARARMLLGDARRHLSAAAEVWHSFRLDSAVERLDHAREAVVAAWVQLGHPAPREGQVRSRSRGPR
jgi:hypothetical protein